MTQREFKKRAERAFRNANPDADDASIVWTRCNTCTWADNTEGWSGTMQISATGYRTRNMIATYHDGGIAVR